MVRLEYGPHSYFRLGTVWPRRKLREPWAGRRPRRIVRGALAPPVTPPPPVEQDLTPGVGLFTPHEDHLKDTLAGLSEMQTWLGAPDATAAGKRIFIGDLPPPPDGCGAYPREILQGMRPLAIVYTSPDGGYRAIQDAVSYSWHYRQGGDLFVLFEQEVPAALKLDHAELRRQFMNSLGLIAQELLQDSGMAGKFAVRRLTCYGPYRGEEDDVPSQGDPIVGYFALVWGNA